MIEEQKIGDSTVLFHSETGAIHVLNDTASIVWRTLRNGKSEIEAAQAIVHAFDAPSEEQVTDDVRTTVKELQRNGLL